MAQTPSFRESQWASVPIKDLGLAIAGTPLEPVLQEFDAEIRARGIRVQPRYYLSTEWGVVTDTIAIAIPFYLAHPQLTDLHAQRVGHLEGAGRVELLRYLRHELGHVIGYAYRLYDDEEWVGLFGPMTRPYVENYRPRPFSRQFVRHLPGWYALKHPDEDWAETFAVWMTPDRDWRADYAQQPTPLRKLEYCDRTMARLRDVEPLVTESGLDDDVATLPMSIDELYRRTEAEDGPREFPLGLDGSLRAIFEETTGADVSPGERRPAAKLIRAQERALAAAVFRWTGHFPERTRALLRHLAERADLLQQMYPTAREQDFVLAFAVMVTALAMNHVLTGNYEPG